MFFYDVIPFSSKKISLSYSSKEDGLIGSLVLINLRGKDIFGIVISQRNAEELENLSFSIKEINSVFIRGFFNEKFILFLKKFSQYNIASIEDSVFLSISTIMKYLTIKNKDKFLLKFNQSDNSLENKEPINGIMLNELQSAVVSKFFIDFDINFYKCTLLDGSTGSGKTYIYCNIIIELLKKYRDIQILVMLPEISLSHYFVEKISKIISLEVVVWNSSISEKQRKENFIKITNGSAKIIIGTRSSIFIPYKNLKFIIVDEEHDSSYKQDSQLIYQGRDMAVLLANLMNIQILLSSATPSISTYNNAINLKKYSYLNIHSRYNDFQMPAIHLVDRSPAKIVSEKSIENMKKFLDSKKKVLIFINRRGYSRMVICTDCGSTFDCVNCDNKLSYHKSKSIASCHYCGYFVDLKNNPNCNKCSSDNISTFGSFGVEKVFQYIKEFFPEKKIKIFSSDTKIDNSECDIMVGTQIVSKGYTFDNLNFCLILDYDGYIGKNDIYRNEILFQNITQVCGRVGRNNSDDSEVYLEVNKNDFSSSEILNIIKNYKKSEFYEKEIEYRKNNSIYPFFSEIMISFSSEKEDKLKEISALYFKTLKNEIINNKNDKTLEIIGVDKFSTYKLFNRFRMYIILRSKDSNLIKNYCFLMQKILLKNNIIKNGVVKIKYDIIPDGLFWNFIWTLIFFSL